MLSCDVLCDLMTVYAAGEASADTRRLVDEHLAQCPACRKAFADAPRIEEMVAAGERPEKPSNGRGFISRTKRVIFTLAVGVLLYFACEMAVFLRVSARVLEDISLSSLPGAWPMWLAIAAAALAIYLMLILSQKPKTAGAKIVDGLFSVLAGIPLLVLTFSSLYLIMTGTIIAAVISFVLILGALVATFVRLPRLRYSTLVTATVMLLANGFLLAQAVDSFTNYGMSAPAERPTFGHPPEGMAPSDAVRIDLQSLGLELAGTENVERIGNERIGRGAEAVHATFAGDGREAILIIARFASMDEAEDFFKKWKSAAASGIQIMSFENNLAGSLKHPVRSLSTYDASDRQAYVAWQSDNWVTIIDVPGSLRPARSLAGKVRDAVFERYAGYVGEE